MTGLYITVIVCFTLITIAGIVCFTLIRINRDNNNDGGWRE